MQIKPSFRENANFEKHGCQNSVSMITSMLTYTSRRLFPDNFREKSLKFGSPRSKGFEVIQLFSEREPKKLSSSGLKRVTLQGHLFFWPRICKH